MKLRKTSIILILSFLMSIFLSALSCTIGPTLFATPTSTPTPTSTSTPTPTNTPTPTATPTPIGGAGWIVFASRETGDDNSDIYAVRVDGSEIRQITHGPGNNWSPDLSPNGNRIIFVSDRNGRKDLYLINFDGSGLTRLTFTDDNIDPEWSPDERSIVFVSGRSGSQRNEIWTAEIDSHGMVLGTLSLVT